MCVTELSPHRPKKRQLASNVDAIVGEGGKVAFTTLMGFIGDGRFPNRER